MISVIESVFLFHTRHSRAIIKYYKCEEFLKMALLALKGTLTEIPHFRCKFV